MSIQITIKAKAGLNIAANLKDEALASIFQMIQEYGDDNVAPPAARSAADFPIVAMANSGAGTSVGASNEQATRETLKSHGAGELLNRLKSDNFPEKILLLAAWYESKGGNTPWRSSDMDDTFKQAKESPPRNFPRDIKNAIKSGWIHAETPRTYTVTRTGWNKIAHNLESMQS